LRRLALAAPHDVRITDQGKKLLEETAIERRL
jgi:hypothetical protein